MARDENVALITGASGGIASAIARVLAGRGWRLVLSSRSGAPDLAAELGMPGHAGSVLEASDMEAAVALAIDTFGRLDGAVFSGGRQSDILRGFDIPPQDPLGPDSFGYDAESRRSPLDIPFEAWRANYEMNVLGPMRVFKAALPAFRAGGGGSFVAMSGIEAMQPRTAYALGPNRLALHGFVKLLSDRYGRENIRANCIAPGLMDNAASEFLPEWEGQVPMSRWGRVEEIGSAVAFLLSPDAGYVTGQTLVVDGGINRTEGL